MLMLSQLIPGKPYEMYWGATNAMAYGSLGSVRSQITNFLGVGRISEHSKKHRKVWVDILFLAEKPNPSLIVPETAWHSVLIADGSPLLGVGPSGAPLYWRFKLAHDLALYADLYPTTDGLKELAKC